MRLEEELHDTATASWDPLPSSASSQPPCFFLPSASPLSLPLLTRHARDDLGRRDFEEGHAALIGDGVCERSLAAAGGPVQQHSAGWLYSKPGIYLRSTGERGRERGDEGGRGGKGGRKEAWAGVLIIILVLLFPLNSFKLRLDTSSLAQTPFRPPAPNRTIQPTPSSPLTSGCLRGYSISSRMSESTSSMPPRSS